MTLLRHPSRLGDLASNLPGLSGRSNLAGRRGGLLRCHTSAITRATVHDGLVVTDGAADGSAEEAVPTGDVTGCTAYGRAAQAADRLYGGRYGAAETHAQSSDDDLVHVFSNWFSIEGSGVPPRTQR